MSSSSGLTFKLHPLVIVNVSDHHTRIKAQQSSSVASSSTSASSAVPVPAAPAPPRVFGCLVGVQTGRTVEIFTSFELKYDDSADCLDRAFLETKQEQCAHALLSILIPS
jgi:COP9 signalosome complex subunit 6